MRYWRQLAAIALFMVLVAGVSTAGDIIDGIAATVNSVAILSSDLDQAARYEALLEARPLESIDGSQREMVLQRLIDQELLRQQMANSFPPPKPQELTERVLEVRKHISGAETDEGWRAALQRYGLTEEELSERIAAQMQIGAFVEGHLHGSVQIDSADVRAYYQDKLLPELRQRRVRTEPPLSEVAGQIEQILRQERMDELLTSWLRSLREQNRIRTGPEFSLRSTGSGNARAEAGK